MNTPHAQHTTCMLWLVLTATFVVTVLAGCSRDSMVEVTGRVTVAGEAVEDGEIHFLPADGKGPSASEVITTGKYTLRVAPGEKSVRIKGDRIVGQRRYIEGNPESPMVPVLEPMVPDRYYTDTDLRRTIDGSTNTLDFELEL